MPILIEASPNAPITQGDILSGLALFATEENWGETGSSYKVKSPLCMVVSRPCAVLHKRQIIVAAIERVVVPLPRDMKTVETVRQFLEELRDGGGSPDRFYLGQQIPNFRKEGRFFARLDSLHTVKVPPSEQLAELLRVHRIATLADDFRRDLHRRVFSAFATLGFDDFGWYPNQDLDWIIAVAEQEVSSLERDIKEKEAQISKNIAAGEGSKNQGLNSEVDKLRGNLTEVRARVEPFKAERAKRPLPGSQAADT
jgi:hypothetical protein